MPLVFLCVRVCVCAFAQLRQKFDQLIRNILSRLQATLRIKVVAGCLALPAHVLNREDVSLAPQFQKKHNNLD